MSLEGTRSVEKYLDAKSDVSSGRKMSLEVGRSVQRYQQTTSEVSSGM